MKIEINLPKEVVRRLAKRDWEMTNGWGVRVSANLQHGQETIRLAAQHALEMDRKGDS